MAFAQFMAKPIGRLIRIVAGLALIIAGISMGGVGGTILAIVGILPLATGVMNVCVLAPFLKAPFSGAAALQNQ